MTEPLLIFPDTCLLMNFARVGRLDVVQAAVDIRGNWTQAVEDEVADFSSTADYQSLTQTWTFMSAALVPTYEEMDEADKIRQMFAKPGDGPLKHLGEAETLAIIDSRFDSQTVILLTEDIGAVLQCRARALKTAGTRAVLESAAKKDHITWADADRIARDIISAGRSVLNYPPPIRAPIPDLSHMLHGAPTA